MAWFERLFIRTLPILEPGVRNSLILLEWKTGSENTGKVLNRY